MSLFLLKKLFQFSICVFLPLSALNSMSQEQNKTWHLLTTAASLQKKNSLLNCSNLLDKIWNLWDHRKHILSQISFRASIAFSGILIDLEVYRNWSQNSNCYHSNDIFSQGYNYYFGFCLAQCSFLLFQISFLFLVVVNSFKLIPKFVMSFFSLLEMEKVFGLLLKLQIYNQARIFQQEKTLLMVFF